MKGARRKLMAKGNNVNIGAGINGQHQTLAENGMGGNGGIAPWRGASSLAPRAAGQRLAPRAAASAIGSRRNITLADTCNRAVNENNANMKNKAREISPDKQRQISNIGGQR